MKTMRRCDCGSGLPVLSRLYVPGQRSPITTCQDCCVESARAALHDTQAHEPGIAGDVLAALALLVMLIVAVMV